MHGKTQVGGEFEMHMLAVYMYCLVVREACEHDIVGATLIGNPAFQQASWTLHLRHVFIELWSHRTKPVADKESLDQDALANNLHGAALCQ